MEKLVDGPGEHSGGGLVPGDEHRHEVIPQLRPKLKGSIDEGPNHSNFLDQSSVRILGIRRKP